MGKKLAVVTIFENTQMLDLPDENLKAAVISMFKELKETLPKELKENTRTMSHIVVM